MVVQTRVKIVYIVSSQSTIGEDIISLSRFSKMEIFIHYVKSKENIVDALTISLQREQIKLISRGMGSKQIQWEEPGENLT